MRRWVLAPFRFPFARPGGARERGREQPSHRGAVYLHPGASLPYICRMPPVRSRLLFNKMLIILASPRGFEPLISWSQPSPAVGRALGETAGGRKRAGSPAGDSMPSGVTSQIATPRQVVILSLPQIGA
jgi:hypothetical protein